MNDIANFQKQRLYNNASLLKDSLLKKISSEWFLKACDHKYSYNFDWLGLPIIQFPQDIVAMQEVIWHTKPDIVIETGIARGGSLMLSASILHLINKGGRVIGVDIDIRPHNRDAIEQHPLSASIQLIQGSSVDSHIVAEVQSLIGATDKVMVILDSNHTHEHVLKELELYSPFVSHGCYLVVMDTVIEYMPKDCFPDRSWGPGDNPKTAVDAFLRTNDRFEVDELIHNKLVITVAPYGYLKCIK